MQKTIKVKIELKSLKMANCQNSSKFQIQNTIDNMRNESVQIISYYGFLELNFLMKYGLMINLMIITDGETLFEQLISAVCRGNTRTNRECRLNIN